MVVIVRDCRCERHVTWHPDLGQGDDERLFLVWGSDVADDPTFVTGIRQVRDNVLGLICDGNMLRSQIGRQRWHQFDLEWRRCLQCGQQPCGLARIIDHWRISSKSEFSDSGETSMTWNVAH